MSKIYDCFTFYNELDLLEIRLNELNSVVDYFVIVEATKTQTGKRKQLYYELNKKRYKKFESKIIHIIVKNMPDIKTNSAWVLENHQRNQIIKGLKNCNLKDIIFISDLDEIPNKNDFKKIISKLTQKESFLEKTTNNLNKIIFRLIFYFNTPELSIKNKIIRKIYRLIEKVIPNKRIIKLKQKWYYYYLNGDANHSAINTRVCTYKTLINDLNSKPNNSRYLFSGNVINSGWHFSYLEKHKLKSKSIADSIDNKKRLQNILNKKIPIKIVPINNTFPKYIQKNITKYKKHICDSYEKNIN